MYFLLYALLINYSLWRNKEQELYPLVSKHRFDEIINLPGKTIEELELKIQMYLEVGDYDKADVCSRSHLTLIENSPELN